MRVLVGWIPKSEYRISIRVELVEPRIWLRMVRVVTSIFERLGLLAPPFAMMPKSILLLAMVLYRVASVWVLGLLPEYQPFFHGFIPPLAALKIS
jgi:hypothetical protein